MVSNLPESPKTNTFTLSREAIFLVTAATRKKIVKTPPAYLLVESDWLQSDREEAKPFVNIYINQHSLVSIGW